MAGKSGTYSNAQLTKRIREAVKPLNPKILSLKLEHEQTVKRFSDRLDEVYRKSRETPVRLRSQ